MRTQWKKGTPQKVYFFVRSESAELTRLQAEIEEIRLIKLKFIRKKSYEEAARIRDQEREKELEIASMIAESATYCGPYHNKPSEKKAKELGARIVSYELDIAI